MANPSLKAKIEAAKSALASDIAVPSSVVSPPKPPMTPTAPTMASDDIATCTGATAAAGIPADGKSAHATNAAALGERITQLEAKLLDNQRDLHTLLQKIRELSRLQTNFRKSNKNRTKDQAETMAVDETKNKVDSRHSQRSPVVMVAMAILIGFVVGIAYFLVTAKGDLSALTVPNWALKIIDRFNG